jgi:hypothetical protein
VLARCGWRNMVRRGGGWVASTHHNKHVHSQHGEPNSSTPFAAATPSHLPAGPGCPLAWHLPQECSVGGGGRERQQSTQQKQHVKRCSSSYAAASRTGSTAARALAAAIAQTAAWDTSDTHALASPQQTQLRQPARADAARAGTRCVNVLATGGNGLVQVLLQQCRMSSQRPARTGAHGVSPPRATRFARGQRKAAVLHGSSRAACLISISGL